MTMRGRSGWGAALGAVLIGSFGLVCSARTAWGAPPVKGIAPPRHARVTAKGSIATVRFWSQALGIHKQAVIWLPPSYQREITKRYAVAYYLHGVSGNETDWTRLGHLDRTLDSLVVAGEPEMIVVMPDGDDGWYTTWNWLGDWPACKRNFTPRDGETADSYCVPWPHYDDYVARDLVSFVDRTYRTRADAAHRGIAGLSMGGYGAVTLAFHYPSVFGAAASHSGALMPLFGLNRQYEAGVSHSADLDSLRDSYGPRLWAMMEQAFGKDTTAWQARDPMRMARVLAGQRDGRLPPLYLDCGTGDFLLGQNEAFSAQLRNAGISFTYRRWPGEHTWDYWRAHAAESATWMARQLSKE